MMIRDMSVNEITAMLERVEIGHIACSVSNQPYVVPIRFVYNGGYLYALTTLGKKMEMMQLNQHVCVNFTEVKASNDWKSLVVSGSFEKIPASDDPDSLYSFAHKVLSRSAEWWVPAYTRTILRGDERPLEPVYFRVSVVQTSGHATEQL